MFTTQSPVAFCRCALVAGYYTQLYHEAHPVITNTVLINYITLLLLLRGRCCCCCCCCSDSSVAAIYSAKANSSFPLCAITAVAVVAGSQILFYPEKAKGTNRSLECKQRMFAFLRHCSYYISLVMPAVVDVITVVDDI